MSLRVVEGPFEKELQRIRQQLLDGAKDPMLVIRGEGVALCNEPARALLRWPTVDMTGVQVRSLFASSSITSLREGWETAHRSSSPVQLKGVAVRRYDAEEEDTDIILFPLAWNDDPTTLVHMRLVTEVDSTVKALKASEKKFRSFIENVSDGVFQSTTEGRLLLVNPALVRMLGYDSAEELLAVNIGTDVYVKKEQRAELLEELRKTGIRANVELRLKKKDGSEIVCLTNTRAVRRASGETMFYEGTLKDVTDWKRVQEELRASQERYKAFITHSTEGIWCFELDEPMSTHLPPEEQLQWLMDRSYLKECNRRMAEMLGHERPEEILGASMVDLFDMRAEPGTAMLREYISKGYRLENREVYVPRPDVSPGVHLSSNVIGIVEDDHLLRSWGTQRDITAQKQAEQQLREAQKMETLGTLAGGVAHDFNNILTVIRGYVDLLRRENLVHEKGEQSISAISTAVKRGAGIVRQLMTFAREDEETKDVVEIRTMFNEVKDIVRMALPENVELIQSVAEDIPDLMGDESTLHQALLNLVMNARDAMQSGGAIVMTAQAVEGSVLVHTFAEADKDLYVRISVSDEGSGIPEKAKGHVFEPFYTTKDIGKGSGLGLAVVYGVARSHAGFVDVKPNGERGTVFHLYIPGYEHVEEGQTHDVVDEPVEGAREETILVVEDEKMLLDLLKLLLESEGYTVMTAMDGVQAVEMYEKHQESIDLVLSDMGLPLLGGYEAFVKMKEINPKLKSILASGYMDPSIRTKLLEAGAMEFLQKPYVPDVVLKSIRTFLERE